MDYLKAFTQAKIKDPLAVQNRANLILFYAPRYLEVSNKVKIPWQIIGCIHSLECACLMTRHLHNGDRLTARTIRIPAGRPKKGKPPFKWEESAIDALVGRELPQSPSLGTWLEFCEAYNGWGYQRRGLPSPYLWSFTDVYERGYFRSDGIFDSEMISQNIGVAALLKGLGVSEETFG